MNNAQWANPAPATQWPAAANNNAAPVASPTPWPTEVIEFDAVMAKPSNSLDAMNEDALLMLWADKKKAIEQAKEAEMDLRKYIVSRAFPQKEEGTNRKDLGNGYALKAVIKYNYNCADNETVEAGLNKLAALGNSGSFIADRLITWTPSFKLTEYRQLQEEKDKGSKFAEDALAIINNFITITNAAPTLDIVEPKAKKK